MSPAVKEYIWSSVVTFVTAFLVAVLPNAAGLDMSQSAVFALFMVGARAGVRAVLNLLTTKFNTVRS